MSNTSVSTEQVLAARNGDLAASAAVVEATEPIIAKLARAAATRVGRGAGHAATLQEEFESIARVAVWELVARFEGMETAQFTTLVHRRLEGAIADAVHELLSPGADKDALKLYVKCLRDANGDTHLAMKLCMTYPDATRRLGADRAYAARQAWEGTASLDAPVPGDGFTTLADIIRERHDYGVPEDLVTSNDREARDRRARAAFVEVTLGTLPTRRREVLKARAGFAGYPSDLTPTDIPELFGLSQTEANRAWTLGCAQFRDTFPIEIAYA